MKMYFRYLKLVAILLILQSVVTDSVAQTCPKVVFLPPYPQADSLHCNNSGEVLINVGICTPDTGEVVLEQIVWNMGNGQTVTTNSTQLIYTYSQSGNYDVSAVAHFTVNGQPCSTSVVLPGNFGSGFGASDLSLMDYCSATSAGTTFPCYVQLLSAQLYIVTNPANQSPIYTSTGVQFKVAYSGVNVNYGLLSYKLRVDGVTVAQGVGGQFLPLDASNVVFPIPVPSFTNYSVGQHIAEITLKSKLNEFCPITSTVLFEVLPSQGTLPSCQDCFTFKPNPGKRYWISAWVKEASTSQVKTYNDAKIALTFNGSSPSTVVFSPTGEIIDGWQRIAADFTVPLGTTSIDIKLQNNSAADKDAFFDDIRIHPFNASMKSYVNDPDTFWLTAELDDNNYATFYEYDMEGKLIRIKKETEKGIVTIQENRASNPKSN